MTANIPVDFVAFNIILDDIVFPDGRTAMGVLGGSGPQTAFGMRLWADRVGLVAGVGLDFPPEAQSWLEQAGLDTTALRYEPDIPTPRAWQVLEEDGRRTQVWRVPGPVLGRQLERSVDKLPPHYRAAKAFHFGLHPEEPNPDFAAALRNLGAIVSVETFKPAGRILPDVEVRQLVSMAHIFSPNVFEAQSLVGPGEPLEVAQRLAQAGAEVVPLRLGLDGAIIHHAQTGETWHIPAAPVTIVDPVGAGNAFCGGFLVGWVNSGDLLTAGLYGVVAASFLVEQVGAPPARPLPEEIKSRLEAARKTATQL
jgi:sugar/nucleoside kinase (ribokinase family)